MSVARAPAGTGWLLLPAPVAALVVVALVVGRGAPARPELVWALAAFPAAALVLAGRARAWRLVVPALLELALLVPLHGLLTFVHAWRLEGG